MNNALFYIHGKGGSADEALHYQTLCPGWDVIGLDYQASTLWEAKKEFQAAYDRIAADHETVVLAANSIGAFFAMHALAEKNIRQALLISPIVNMEKLISDMMGWAGVTEQQLREQGEIATPFGETLSWEYLTYVREHPIEWTIPTEILYADKDHLTAYDTMAAFADEIHAGLTVMENGEHWFHTDGQMAFLDQWFRNAFALL